MHFLSCRCTSRRLQYKQPEMGQWTEAHLCVCVCLIGPQGIAVYFVIVLNTARQLQTLLFKKKNKSYKRETIDFDVDVRIWS